MTEGDGCAIDRVKSRFGRDGDGPLRWLADEDVADGSKRILRGRNQLVTPVWLALCAIRKAAFCELAECPSGRGITAN